MRSIDDLPIELYSLIFKNLSIKDLFNCRLVNKKIKFSTYESIHKLVIDNEFEVISWNYNNELINDDDIISFKCFISIKSIFNFDKYLKYLKINSIGEEFKNKFLLNLNDLTNLECLEISTNNNNSKLNFNFNFKNLKYFTIDCLDDDNCLFELNAPKLERLQFSRMENISFKSYPESIKHLITWNYDDKLKVFKNLETIEFTNAHKSELNENLLYFFNNLKQLKIEIHNLMRNFDQVEVDLIKILNKRTKLNKDVNIYFEGVKLMDIQKLNEIKSYKSILEYQIENYDLLDLKLPRNVYLYYPDLNNSIKNNRNDLPSSFFNKYQNIAAVYVIGYTVMYNRNSIDPDDLNWFLYNLKSLKILKIRNISLNQFFFNNLPNTIRYLYIDEYCFYIKSLININFGFILKLNKLIEFKLEGIDIDLFDLASTSFLYLKYLRKFEFNFKRKTILIERRDKSFYFNSKLLNYDDLIKTCDEIKSE